MADKVETPTFTEAGVHYYRITWPSLQEHPWPGKLAHYVCIHKPTGHRYQRTVYVDNPRADVPRLCDYWSRGDWEYEPGTDTQLRLPLEPATS